MNKILCSDLNDQSGWGEPVSPLCTITGQEEAACELYIQTDLGISQSIGEVNAFNEHHCKGGCLPGHQPQV